VQEAKTRAGAEDQGRKLGLQTFITTTTQEAKTHSPGGEARLQGTGREKRIREEYLTWSDGKRPIPVLYRGFSSMTEVSTRNLVRHRKGGQVRKVRSALGGNDCRGGGTAA